MFTPCTRCHVTRLKGGFARLARRRVEPARAAARATTKTTMQLVATTNHHNHHRRLLQLLLDRLAAIPPARSPDPRPFGVPFAMARAVLLRMREQMVARVAERTERLRQQRLRQMRALQMRPHPFYQNPLLPRRRPINHRNEFLELRKLLQQPCRLSTMLPIELLEVIACRAVFPPWFAMMECHMICVLMGGEFYRGDARFEALLKDAALRRTRAFPTYTNFGICHGGDVVYN